MRLSLLAALVATMFFSPPLCAQPNSGPPIVWRGVQNIGPQEGLVPAARLANGRTGFICRGAVEGARLVGWVAQELTSCTVSTGNSAVRLTNFEVLVVREAPGAGTGAHAVSGTTRGIDENGVPYVETPGPNGTRERRTSYGRVTILPDGKKGNSISFQNAPTPTPPQLPTSDASGRLWFSVHNETLLKLISQTVDENAEAMRAFSASEQTATQGNVLSQIYFRTRALQVLVSK
jgi:hypothetical protein